MPSLPPEFRLRDAWRHLCTLVTERRGSITVFAAGAITVVVGVAAMMVDLGSVTLESRRLQGIADAAALSAAGNIASAQSSAIAAVTASGSPLAMTTVVTTGTYTPDPALAVASRFVAGGAQPNAARVKVTTRAPLYFARAFGMSSMTIARSAVATRKDLVSFSIGARIASLNGGLVNQLLSGLTGSSISLSVGDYNALLGADVDLLAFVAALRTQLNLSGATYEHTLKAGAKLPQVLNALAAALTAGGQPSAAASAVKLALTAGNTNVDLSTLIDLGELGKQDTTIGRTSLKLNAFDLVHNSLELAGANRQIALDLGTALPGIASATVKVAVGERAANSPWIVVTDKTQMTVRTGQARVYLDATLLANPLLQALGIGPIHLPLFAELGASEAKLQSASCTGGTRAVALAVTPAVAHVSIADIATASFNDMNTAIVESPAKMVDILGIRVVGSARIDASSSAPQTVHFTGTDIDNRVTKTVNSSGIVGGLTSSLVNSLNLTVYIGSFAVPLSPIIALLKPVLSLVAAVLDPIVDGLLELLGIHLGQADVQVNGFRCGLASLVA